MGNIILIGGAKGTGKSSLIKEVCLENKINFISTGRIIEEYEKLKLEPQAYKRNAYITHRLISESGTNLIVDTHFAAYPPIEDKRADYSFKRGLESKHLFQLEKDNIVSLCLITLSPEELLIRRLKDPRKRITDKKLIEKELKYNEAALRMYSRDLKKTPLIVYNHDFQKAKTEILAWLTKII